MKIERRGRVFWIVGIPDLEFPEAGPYEGDTLKEARASAAEDLPGIKRFYREELPKLNDG